MEIRTNNYFRSRVDPNTGKQYKPEAVVNHITASGFLSTKNWIEDPRSFVSYNWIIHNGRAIEVVPEEHAAWGNGHVVNPTWTGLKRLGFGDTGDDFVTIEARQDQGEKGNSLILLETDKVLGAGNVIVNPNLYTVSVAVVTNGKHISWEDWQAWVKLNRQIRKRQGFELNEKQCVNHYEIKTTKTCPRTFYTRFYLQALDLII